jgi:hypothetical protein
MSDMSVLFLAYGVADGLVPRFPSVPPAVPDESGVELGGCDSAS